MSLILCTSECLYQVDGYCSLERALSGGEPNENNPCINFVPKRHQSKNGRQSFADVSDSNQL